VAEELFFLDFEGGAILSIFGFAQDFCHEGLEAKTNPLHFDNKL
jgi:hypothetical protein